MALFQSEIAAKINPPDWPSEDNRRAYSSKRASRAGLRASTERIQAPGRHEAAPACWSFDVDSIALPRIER
jgi:hypothetical protein